jgi:hypothetical protein
MLLRAAQHDIRIRGYRDVAATLRTVFRNISTLVPFEVTMDKGHQRMKKTFPPYSPSYEASLPALLEEVAKKVKPVDRERSWIDPFDEFKEASDAIVGHYREVAGNVNFEGVLLEKWTVDSLLRAARVHNHLLDNPPAGAERFLNTVEKCLRRLNHAAAFFFRETSDFPYHHASEACDELACIGMGLLQRQRFEAATACGEAIHSIARKSALATSSKSYHSAYGFADCVVKLEILARAAEAFDNAQLASAFRELAGRPENTPEADWQEFTEAVGARTRQMEEKLRERGREFRLRDSSVDVLREILRQRRTELGVSTNCQTAHSIGRNECL